jgi:hypothetical protein
VSPKTTTLFLAASLVANAALIALIEVRAPEVLSFRWPGRSRESAESEANEARTTMAGDAPAQGSWSSVFSPDLKILVARLRGAGYPPRVVRAIVKAQLDELFAPRYRDLAADRALMPYWSPHFGEWDPKLAVAQNALSMDESRMLSALLGPADPANALSEMDEKQRQGSLSSAKYSQVQEIANDYNELVNEVYQSTRGSLLQGDIQKIHDIQKEQEADIAAALTPEELFDYQLRNNPAAGMLRSNLRAFNPSEQEFRTLFSLQQAFDGKYGSPYGPFTAEQSQARMEHQADLNEQIQNALGPERFAEYKQQTEPEYLALTTLTDRFELPVSAAGDVLAVRKDIDKRAEAVRKNPNLSASDKKALLSSLADEAAAKAGAVLGDRALAAYKEQNKWWFSNLAGPVK